MSTPEIERFINEVELIAVLDHSGRAGNSFVLSVFDKHPEILTCGWLHYAYSYIVAKFGDSVEIDAKEAHRYWTTESYYRFTYLDMDETIKKRLEKVGADTSVEIDRKQLRNVFDEYIFSKKMVSRKELLLASYYSYAKADARDISRIKYILVDDAVSLRTENPLAGFSGKVIHAMVEDFQKPRLVSLVRDPRAAFASTRHQYVNEKGNMYGYFPNSVVSRFLSLFGQNLTQEDCACLFVWVYHAAAARIIYNLKERYRDNFFTLKNEDLNLDFIPTLEKFCEWLNVNMYSEWSAEGFVPTMMGAPWRGTGAYNNRYYSKETFGLLENDSNEVSEIVTGPNEYVTKRWRGRLSCAEIKLCEIFFRDELEDLEYPFLFEKARASMSAYFICNVFRPFKGELPTVKWLLNGRFLGGRELLNRIFYSLSFVPFYIVARCVLIKLAVFDKFFGLGLETGLEEG